jgi:hypothetical protein
MHIGWVRFANRPCIHEQVLILLFLLRSSPAELGSVFYSVKEKHFDERGARRKADREFSKRAELESEMARQRDE